MDDKEPTGASPDTVAWRLTAVESAVKDLNAEGKNFRKEVIDKLDGIASGFATHKDVEQAKEQSKAEHDAIYLKISDVEKEVQAIKTDADKEIAALKRRNWVQNTLSAILGVILTLLIGYFINGVIH